MSRREDNSLKLAKAVAREAIVAIFDTTPGESFAHVACVFLQDWRAGRLTGDEVCDTLWAAAVARGLNKEQG